MNVLFSVLLSFLSASATLDKSGHLMFVEYSINEPTKDEGVIYVDILFHYKGQTYKVARHRYPEPITSIVDTFPWFSKDKWEGGDLEVVAKRADGSVERSYISEQSIAIKDLGYEPPKFEHKMNSALVKIDDGPDPYAWRMLGYDPGHTGYYPFSLYPPLDSLWMLPEWGHPGSWITDVSAAAGHDMLLIPKSASQWNILTARDIETGEIIWQRYVTANVMTTALSEGDSILFVGTVIGYTPWKDTTFYALDPFTGKFKWGKSFKTVEYSPIVVDSLVYVSSLGLPAKLACWNYEGDSIWALITWMTCSSPAFNDGIVLHTGKDTLHNIYEQDSILYARDWLKGELLWDFAGSGDIPNLMGYNRKIVFSPFLDPLYAVDVHTGNMIWVSYLYNPIANVRVNSSFSIVHWAYGQYCNDTIVTMWFTINENTGDSLWDTLLIPPDTNSGRTTLTLSSQDSLFWITNCSRIYVFHNHNPLFVKDLPRSPAIWPSWNFPIFYRNYFIYAHEDFLIVYRTDTSNCRDSIPSSGSTGVLYSPDGQMIFHFVVQKPSPLSLHLYTVDGRKVWELHEPLLPAGTYNLNLPELPHSGVYILRYSFSNLTGAERFIYIKRK